MKLLYIILAILIVLLMVDAVNGLENNCIDAECSNHHGKPTPEIKVEDKPETKAEMNESAIRSLK